MNCSASYVITYLCCYEASSEAASDKSERFPVWSYFRLHQTKDKKTLCSKKKKRKKRTKTSGEKLMGSGQVWKRLIVMDYDTQLQYVPTSVMWRDKIILPLSKILFKGFLFFREGERKERNSELPVCFSMILATSLVWTEGFFQDSCIWRVLIVDHIPAPLWSLSWWIIYFAGTETCSGAPQRRIQCPEEDVRSIGFCVFSQVCYIEVLHCLWYLRIWPLFFPSSLKPLKKVFSTANYEAFPTLSLKTGLHHCTLCWFLLHVHSLQLEVESDPRS